MPENLAARLRAALRAPGAAGGDLALTAALQNARTPDIAEAMRDLVNSEALAVFNWLDNARAAEVLGGLESDTARYILNNAPPYRIADLLDRLPMDDAAWVVSEADPDRAQIFMNALEARAPQDAAEVTELLLYDENTAGRLMTDNFVRFFADMSVREGIADVRRADPEVETIAALYVIEFDEQKRERLIGVLSLRGLLRSPDETRIEEIMTRDVISVHVDTDQEEVARLTRKYDLLAIPVLDREGFLAGIVTVDDVLDVLTEEQTEDTLLFGGIEAGALTAAYFSTPIFGAVRSRVTWLILLFIGGLLTSRVLQSYEEDLVSVPALTAFIPLLIGTGGNTGAQTVVSVIRGLALRDIAPRDWGRVFTRELVGGVLLGLMLGVLGFGFALMLGNAVPVGVVVALSIVAICTWSNTIGSLIPIAAQRLRLDPALVSAPLITTLVDATGLVIYLSIARLVLSSL